MVKRRVLRRIIKKDFLGDSAQVSSIGIEEAIVFPYGLGTPGCYVCAIPKKSAEAHMTAESEG